MFGDLVARTTTSPGEGHGRVTVFVMGRSQKGDAGGCGCVSVGT